VHACTGPLPRVLFSRSSIGAGLATLVKCSVGNNGIFNVSCEVVSSAITAYISARGIGPSFPCHDASPVITNFRSREQPEPNILSAVESKEHERSVYDQNGLNCRGFGVTIPRMT
jgi:hypothetical protein